MEDKNKQTKTDVHTRHCCKYGDEGKECSVVDKILKQ